MNDLTLSDLVNGKLLTNPTHFSCVNYKIKKSKIFNAKSFLGSVEIVLDCTRVLFFFS